MDGMHVKWGKLGCKVKNTTKRKCGKKENYIDHSVERNMAGKEKMLDKREQKSGR